MARKKRKVSLKAVVSEIAKTARELEKIRRTASDRDKVKLDLKINSLTILNAIAGTICRSKTARLDIWSPVKALKPASRP